MAGSVFVIAISFVEDFRELFGPNEPASEASQLPQSTHGVPAAHSYASPR